MLQPQNRFVEYHRYVLLEMSSLGARALIEAARGLLNLDRGEREENASDPPPPFLKRAAAFREGRSRGLRWACWRRRGGAGWSPEPARGGAVLSAGLRTGRGTALVGNVECHPWLRSGGVLYPRGPGN